MSDPITETGRTYDVIAAEYARRTSMLDSELLDTIRAHGCRVIGLDLSIGQLRTGGLPGVVQADMRHLSPGSRSTG